MIIIDCETEINFVFHVKHIIGCCSWLMSDRADVFRRYGTGHRTLFVVSESARDIKDGGLPRPTVGGRVTIYGLFVR